jgi:hypothetical protein
MDIQTGKLYQMQFRYWVSIPPKLVVITGISEERNWITYYRIDTGRLYSAFLNDFKADYTLSLT